MKTKIYGRPVAAVLSIAILLIISASCNFKEPVLPSWEATFRIPFSVEDFVLGEEIINDDTPFIDSTIVMQSGDTNRVLFVSLKDSMVDLKDITAGDLSINPENTMESLSLDTLEIASLETISLPLITLREIIPGLSALVGQTVTIPETTVVAPPTVWDAGDFKRIHFLSGLVRLRVLNNFPFPIGPNSSAPGGMSVSVINDSLNEEFIQLDFPETISPGETAEAEAVIGDKWLYSPLRLEYQVPVAEQSSVTITNALLDTTGFAISLYLENIRADEAVAQLQAQDFSSVIKIGYDDKHRLRSAEIERGEIFIELFNHITVAAMVSVKIPAIKTAANDTFTTSVAIPANASETLLLNLDDHTISNPDNPGAFLDSLTLVVDGVTESQNAIVHLNSEDSLSVNIISDTITFKSFAGFLGEDTLDVEPYIENDVADYEGFEGSVELSEAFLRLRIYSEVQIDELIADLKITGYHENQGGVRTDSAVVIIDGQTFTGGRPGNPGVSEVIFNSREIVEFLNILPTSIEFEGQIRVSGEAAIEQGNRIYTEYLFESPFRIRINGIATFEGEVDTLTDANVDTLVQDAAEENILEANLEFTLTNHTPFGGTMRFIVTADDADTNLYDMNYDTSLVLMRDITVQPAPTDAAGFVTGARESEIVFRLNQREIQLFQDPPLRYGYLFEIPDTGGFVTLSYYDYVSMLGRARIQVLIKE